MGEAIKRVPETKMRALAALRGGGTLLRVLGETQGVYLVGGAVRDLMLGFAQFDFDLAVESEAASVAELLAGEIGGEVTVHERFGTATFRSADGELFVDIAGTRTETYAAPGALPDVAPATIAEDLQRRDFTVNAMAMALWRERCGDLVEFDGASADLAARVLRVTHERSFVDDPTRLLRMLRYGARLGFTAEPFTEELARRAVAAGAPATVSGSRIADELIDLLAERSALVAIDSMHALELDRALHPLFEADEYLAARATLRMPEGVRQDLLLLAVCCLRMDASILEEWLDQLALRQRDRAVVKEAVLRHDEIPVRLAGAGSPSQRDSVLRAYKPETVVLAVAMPGVDRAVADAAHAWLTERREDHLCISGADLRNAGVAEGPAIGRALADTMARALDGELSGREDQLRHALSVAQAGAPGE